MVNFISCFLKWVIKPLSMPYDKMVCNKSWELSRQQDLSCLIQSQICSHAKGSVYVTCLTVFLDLFLYSVIKVFMVSPTNKPGLYWFTQCRSSVLFLTKDTLKIWWNLWTWVLKIQKHTKFFFKNNVFCLYTCKNGNEEIVLKKSMGAIGWGLEGQSDRDAVLMYEVLKNYQMKTATISSIGITILIHCQ